MPSLSWFSPAGISISALSSALLIAAFIYWGWDTAVTTNEEADDPATTPGKAAILSTVLLLLTYALVSVATISFAGVGTDGIGLGNEDNADDVFSVIGAEVLGGWDWIVLVAVLVSAVASTQTTILPAARGTLSMGIYRAIMSQFSRTHPRYMTPSVSTVFIGSSAAVIYVLLSLLGENVYGDVLLAIGLMIAFYYGITAYACVWYFRHDIRDGGTALWIKGVLPLLGALMLTFAFFRSAFDMLSLDYGYLGGWTVPGLGWEIGSVFLLGIGSMALGLTPMWILSRREEQKPFFKGHTLHVDTPVEAPD
jgi:amino acid transporter